jgi:hypothetical protein
MRRKKPGGVEVKAELRAHLTAGELHFGATICRGEMQGAF